MDMFFRNLKLMLLLFFSLLFYSNIHAQANFRNISEYEFKFAALETDKVFLVADEDSKNSIELKKSADGTWKVKGRDATKISEFLNSGKALKVIDGKMNKMRINDKTEALMSFGPKDVMGKGTKRTFELKADKDAAPMFKNTTKRKRTRNLQETEFDK